MASVYAIIIPEQFTVKAQQPLLGVKKRRRRGRRGRRERRRRSKNIFSSGNLMSCPELYSQVKSDNTFFCLAEILGARSQFVKGLFLFSSRNLENCPELYSKVKSDKKIYFLGEDFLDFYIFVGKSLFQSEIGQTKTPA